MHMLSVTGWNLIGTIPFLALNHSQALTKNGEKRCKSNLRGRKKKILPYLFPERKSTSSNINLSTQIIEHKYFRSRQNLICRLNLRCSRGIHFISVLNLNNALACALFLDIPVCGECIFIWATSKQDKQGIRLCSRYRFSRSVVYFWNRLYLQI